MKLGWKHWTAGCVLLAVLAGLVVVWAIGTGLADRWMYHEIVNRIEAGTGTRVEIGRFHVELWRLRAEIDNMTVHGTEGAAAPPLFHADRIQIAIRIISLFRRQIALNDLIVERPQIVVTVDKSGKSNLPTPQGPASGTPWTATLFDLRAQHMELRDGSVVFNNKRSNLTVQGQNLNFTLAYVAAAVGADAYVGNFSWQQVQLAQQHDMPFRFDISAKFTLHRDAFALDELVWKLPHSELDLEAQLPSFARSDWSFRYRGRLSLADVRTIYKSPLTPDAITDFSGHASYSSEASAGNEWTATGNYRSHDIKLPYMWFHAVGLETSGDYTVTKQKVTVPNFKVRALGGAIDGRVEMDFRGLAFRTQTHLRGDSLRAIFAALENRDFPVQTLHWDGSVDVDSVNTWNANFLHFRSTGKSTWTVTHAPVPGIIPVTASVDYDYSNDREEVDLGPSDISTPSTQVNFSGSLGAKDSALEVQLRARDLSDWGDFINILRGPDVTPVAVAGQVDWDGRILGPLAGPRSLGIFMQPRHITRTTTGTILTARLTIPPTICA